MRRVEQDFRNALERLDAGQPTHPELVSLMRGGRLRVSVASLAKEAGHSRRLIYAYKDLIEAIRLRRKRPAKSSKAIESELRSELAYTMSQRNQAIALNASLMVLVEQLKADIQDLNRKLAARNVIDFGKRR